MKPVETAIVRILALNKASIVGVGFLVSSKRVMTCAHVVATALGIDRNTQTLPAHQITLDFPLVDDNHPCTASVVLWLPPAPDGTGDIAVLELHEQRPFSTTVAKLVEIGELWGKTFGSYGYPQSEGGWASGVVRGKIKGKRFQINNKDDKSYFIQPGFSGSPVYCNEDGVNGVIGMVSSGETDPDLEVGFMIPAETLLTWKDAQNIELPSASAENAVPTPAKTSSANDAGFAAQMFSRQMQSRIVYIGKFAEMRRQLKAKRVFIAHPFFGGNPQEMEDYRLYIKDGLEGIGYLPQFARDDSGTLLETICQDIIDTEAGVYDVTGYNANVLIELGISIGLNQPTVVIAQDDNAPLITSLQELNPVRYESRYDLASLLGPAVQARIQTYQTRGMSPTFCASCGVECAARKAIQTSANRYSLMGANPQKDKAIYYHLGKAAKNFDLAQFHIEGDFNYMVCRWAEEIKHCKLVFFHSLQGASKHSGTESADTMIRVGIGIGLGTAWRMVLKQGEVMPTDLEGYKYTSWGPNDTVFASVLSSAVRQLLSEVRPYGGIYDALPPLDLIEDEEIPMDSNVALQPELMPRILIVNDNDFERKQLAKMLSTQGWEIIEATTNAQALEQLSLHDFAIVITDSDRKEDRYGEEGLLGLDLAVQLQDKMPVIVYSAFGEERIRELQSGLHPAAFMKRSDSEETVIETISKILEQPNRANKLSESNDISYEVQKHILITYHPKNVVAEKFALAFNQNLKEQNFVTWIDQERLKDVIGKEWKPAIREVILKSRVLVTVYSEEQANSDDFKYEIVTASEINIPIIVVLPSATAYSKEEQLPQFLRDTAAFIIDSSLYSDWYEQVVTAFSKNNTGSKPQSANIPTELFQQAVRLLQPFFVDKDEREAWLTQAFYLRESRLFGMIDRTGSALVFTTKLVKTLFDFGCIDEKHALSILLESLSMGAGENERQQFDILKEALNNLCDISAKEDENTPWEITNTQIQTVSTPSSLRTPTLFMNYSHRDADFVQRLIADLNKAGHAVWIDESSIKGGDNWSEAITEGINNSYGFVHVVSPDSIASKWVQREFMWAEQENKPIFPVMARRCQMPLYMIDRQYVDFTSDYEQGLSSLLRILSAITRTDVISSPNDVIKMARQLEILLRNILKDKDGTQLGRKQNVLSLWRELLAQVPQAPSGYDEDVRRFWNLRNEVVHVGTQLPPDTARILESVQAVIDWLAKQLPLRSPVNPFQLTPAISPKFYGRSLELDRILGYVQSGSSVAVVGPIRIGKTSLLMRLKEKLKELPNVTSVFFHADTLTTDNRRANSFLELLSEDLNREMGLISSISPGSDLHLLGRELQTFIETQFQHRKLVIIVDEFAALFSKDDEAALYLAQWLRGLIVRSRNVMFVVSSIRNLEEIEPKSNMLSPLYTVFAQVRLDALDYEAAKAMIQQAGNPEISEDMVRTILKETGGHPYLIQRLCMELYSWVEQNQAKILTMTDLDQVISTYKQALAAMNWHN